MNDLPVWCCMDEPMPWWVERGYHAFVVEYERAHAPVPIKRSKVR